MVYCLKMNTYFAFGAASDAFNTHYKQYRNFFRLASGELLNPSKDSLERLCTMIAEIFSGSRIMLFRIKTGGEDNLPVFLASSDPDIKSKHSKKSRTNVPNRKNLYAYWETDLINGAYRIGKKGDFSRVQEDLLKEEKIKSFGVFPIMIEEKLSGFLEVDFPGIEHTWNEAEIAFLSGAAGLAAALIPGKEQSAESDKEDTQVREILEHLPDAIFQAAIDGRIVYANPAAYRLFGYSRAEVIDGLNVYSLLTEEEHERARENLKKVLSGFDVEAREYLLRKKDGKIFPARIHSVATQSGGEVKGFLGIISDMTRQKQHERLQERRIEFIELLNIISNKFISIPLSDITGEIEKTLAFICTHTDNARGYIFLFDKDRSRLQLEYEWCSEGTVPHAGILESIAVADFKDFTETLEKGGTVQTHYSDVIRQPGNAALKNIIETLSIKSFINVPIIIGDGMIGYIGFDSTEKEKRWSPETIYAFTHTGQVIGNALERFKTSRKIFRQQAELRALLDNIPYLAWMKDRKGRYIAVNQAFGRNSGYKIEEIIGKDDFDLWPPEKARRIRQEDIEIMEQGSKSLLEVESDIFDSKRWYEIFRTPIFGEEEQVLGTVGLAQDITGRKNAELSLRESEQILKKISDVKDKLLSVIAHDLRAPVTSLATLLQLLVSHERILSEDEKDRYLLSLRDETENMLGLLDNLIKWAKRQQNGIVVTIDSVPLLELIDLNLKYCRHRADYKSISIVNKLSGEETVQADRDLLSAVIRNVLSNAVKFTSPGGSITICGKKENGCFELRVSDTGEGIPEDKLDLIFQENIHYSTKGTGNERGAGIGLALSRAFMENMRGTLSIESRLKRGTTVYIRIPA